MPSSSSTLLFNTDSSRWLAVQTRNPLAASSSSSSFVYCVTTTKICCRPTCKARLARRSNVLFHDSYAAATAAGFRACKRCRPELQREPDSQADAVAGACRRLVGEAEAEAQAGVEAGAEVEAVMETETEAVDFHVDVDENGGGGEKTKRRKRGGGGGDGGLRSRSGQGLTLGDLAREAGLTKSHFHRVFKRVTGVTPRVYAANVRAERMLGASGEVSMQADMPELVVSEAISVEDSSTDGALTPAITREEKSLGAGEDLMGLELQSFPFDTDFEFGGDSVYSGLTTTTTEKFTIEKNVEYTVQPWASGFVLIAATNDGVCWLEAGNSVAELSLSLAHEFQLANLEVSEWSTNASAGDLQNGKYGMFATVMEALTRPTGKVLNIPFDIS